MPLGNALGSLSTLALVVLCALLAGRLVSRLGQPTVLGSILVGVAIGTAVTAAPDSVGDVLVTPASRSLIEAVGTAGLLLLMFSVGIELRSVNTSDTAAPGWRKVPAVLLPIILCATAARPFAGQLTPPHGSSLSAWWFVGIALGITAVPVLVTILQDLRISALPIPRVALRIAVVTDGLAWILVTALVVGTAGLTTLSVPAMAAGVGLLLISIVALPRIIRHHNYFQHGGRLVAMMVVATLIGAAATQLLGFHPAIGAVLAGLSFPAGLDHTRSQRIFASVITVLLPAFFVSSAMSVPVQALHELISWPGVRCAVVLAVAAIVAKVAAGAVYGLLHGWPWRSAATLGVLLNCRGVTEIAIASVGFHSGLIDAFAFATLCAIAILTTAATAPWYRALTATAQPATSGAG